MATTYANAPAFIEEHVLYRESELARRLGWGRKALTAAKQRGLPVMKSGKTNYVHGAACVAWFKQQSEQQEAAR